MTLEVPAFLKPLHPIEPSPSRGTDFSVSREVVAFDGELQDVASAPELPVDVPNQSLGNWCWAATTAAIQAFYHEPGAKSQCEVASYWLAMTCCPPGPDVPDNPRNQPYDLSTSLAKNLAPPVIRDALPPDQLVLQLANGRPVCCAIQWPNGEMHFNVIAGYNASSGDVIVHDPKYSRNEIPLEELRSHYRNTGRWVASLLTKKG